MSNTCAKMCDAVQSVVCDPVFCKCLAPKKHSVSALSSVDVCALTSAQSIKRTATAITGRMKISSWDGMAHPLVALSLSPDLLICAKELFVGAKQVERAMLHT
jgi:hypothetical protein